MMGVPAAVGAETESSRFELSIASQPLGDALRSLAQKTGVQIARFVDLGEQLPNTHPVNGTYTLDQALEIMLANLGLRHVHVNERTIAIVRSPEPGPAAPVVDPVAPVRESDNTRTGDPPAVKKPNAVTRAVALALACTPFGAMRDACAAEVAPADDIEEIVVTGSRVAGTAPVGANVISIGREQIIESGALTLDRLIKEVPQVFDLGVSEASRAQSGGAGNIVYGNSVNIRGIGPYATLIMVDGHRVVNNSRSTDPSILPTLGVERVEVLADGGSAIYGSDAIAGVVNLIPRRNLDGGEVSARYGFDSRGDFSEWQAGGAIGKVWDAGQVMLAFEHAYRSNLNGDERGFFTSDQRPAGGPDRRITRCSPGTLRVGNTSFAIPAGGVTPASASTLVAGSSNLCEEFPGQDLLPEQKYDSLNATLTHALNDRLTLFADGFWSQREFSRQPGPATLNRQQVPATNAFFVTPPGVTLPVCPASVTGVPAGTRCLTVDYSFIDDLPADIAAGSATSWQVVPGVRVNLGGGWQFEGLFSYGRNEDRANSSRGINTAAVATALRSSNPATALDVFGGHRTTEATLAAISDQLSISPVNNRFRGYEARFSGRLFDLPAGAVKLAAGYEGQDQDVALGGTRGPPGTVPVFRYFDRQVDSAYGELLLPLFGANNARRGLRRLDLNVALRYDTYSDVGHTTNPKIGINWEPSENLTFRGNWGTSFRAPLISQIHGNSSNLFVQSRQDPLAGGASVQGVALSGSNLNLAPEEAKTWSAGVDWQALPDLRLGATFFTTDYKNQVNTFLSELTILSQASDLAGTGIVLRGTAAANQICNLVAQGITLSAGTFPGGSCSTVTTFFVDGRNFNLGRSITRGIDVQGNYRVQTAAAGTFSLNLNGTYLTRYRLSVAPGAVLRDRLDLIFNPLRLKMRATVNWDLEPLWARVAITHVGGYTNDVVTPAESVGTYTPVDLSFGVRFRDAAEGPLAGMQLALEVRNLFDTQPPYVNLAPNQNGSGGYDASTTNPIGRQFGVALRKSW
jgi:iron complex outermembrane receptor protein